VKLTHFIMIYVDFYLKLGNESFKIEQSRSGKLYFDGCMLRSFHVLV
jgi:hypothetical protein